jgi:hypothetical protein
MRIYSKIVIFSSSFLILSICLFLFIMNKDSKPQKYLLRNKPINSYLSFAILNQQFNLIDTIVFNNNTSNNFNCKVNLVGLANTGDFPTLKENNINYFISSDLNGNVAFFQHTSSKVNNNYYSIIKYYLCNGKEERLFLLIYKNSYENNVDLKKGLYILIKGNEIYNFYQKLSKDTVRISTNIEKDYLQKYFENIDQLSINTIKSDIVINYNYDPRKNNYEFYDNILIDSVQLFKIFNLPKSNIQY